MIVRRTGDNLQLITQPDHAHLAARIMEHCVPLGRRPRRAQILHAIREHDNGWAEEDAAPTVDPATGAIYDFTTAPLALRHRVWPRGVNRLADDPWVAALVANHALTVYDRFKSEPSWSAFFSEMEKMRYILLRSSGLPLEELLGDYAFLRLADLISLTFCNGWTEEQRFAQWRVKGEGMRVRVGPSAFGGTEFDFEITARTILYQVFKSDAELREAIRHATEMTFRGTVKDSPVPGD